MMNSVLKCGGTFEIKIQPYENDISVMENHYFQRDIVRVFERKLRKDRISSLGDSMNMMTSLLKSGQSFENKTRLYENDIAVMEAHIIQREVARTFTWGLRKYHGEVHSRVSTLKLTFQFLLLRRRKVRAQRESYRETVNIQEDRPHFPHSHLPIRTFSMSYPRPSHFDHIPQTTPRLHKDYSLALL